MFGELYLACNEDSKCVSEISGNSVQNFRSGDLQYVLQNKTDFEPLIRELLLVRQYRVEVHTKSTATNTWSVRYKASPGNLAQFEDVLFEANPAGWSTSIHVMAIRIINKLVAVAAINTVEMRMEVCELHDNECYTELETLIAQIAPRECILPIASSAEATLLRKLLQRNNIAVETVKSSDFTVQNLTQDLDRLLYFHADQQRNSSQFPETKFEYAMGCLQAIVKYLSLVQNEQNFNQFHLATLNVHRFVRLDNAALYALNILSAAATNHNFNVTNSSASKSFSLFGILDNCCSSQGKRLLEKWIKHPLRDLHQLNERLDVVEHLVCRSEFRLCIQTEHLTRFPDLLPLTRKLASKKGNLHDCYRVYQIVCQLPRLVDALLAQQNASIASMLAYPLKDLTGDLSRYRTMIEEVMDLAVVEHGEYIVKSTYDDDLGETYSNQKRIREQIERLASYAAQDLGLDLDKTVKLDYNETHGFYLRVTAKEEPALRAHSNKYEILNVIKSGVWFNTRKMAQLNSDYADAKKLYETQQAAIVAELLDVASGYIESLRNVNLYAATLDVLVAFAQAACTSRIPYVRPRLHASGGVLRLERMRHPCIEQLDRVAFIANSVELDEAAAKLHIVTGPNMCGKSTFIRSVGVCVLMAHIGSFVPCQRADIPLVDAILARIGAEDCQHKNLSTFMLEMAETAAICNTATRDSLVIIDELGRGTATYDGCSIAMAVAEHLAANIKAYTLFATHFYEITNLADRLPHISNLHVSAIINEDETMTPLYQVLEGRSANSYGIHCARMADFPQDVIEAAESNLRKLESSNGSQFIKDVGIKQKNQIIKDGDVIIRDTLKKLKTVHETSNGDIEVMRSTIKQLKEDLLAGDNLFVKSLLTD